MDSGYDLSSIEWLYTGIMVLVVMSLDMIKDYGIIKEWIHMKWNRERTV